MLSLDGRLAVRCTNTTLSHREVKRFVRLGRWVYKVQRGGDTLQLLEVAKVIQLALPNLSLVFWLDEMNYPAIIIMPGGFCNTEMFL